LIAGVIGIIAASPLAGQAISFPLAVGIATGVGTIFTYIIQPKGKVGLLAAGVAFALLASLMGAIGSWLRGRREQRLAQEKGVKKNESSEKLSSTNEDKPKEKSSSYEEGEGESGEQLSNRYEADDNGMVTTAAGSKISKKAITVRGVVICVVSGVVVSGWSPLATLAQKGNGCPTSDDIHCHAFKGLQAYTALIYFSFGSFCTAAIVLPLLLKLPIDPTEKSVSFLQSYFSLQPKAHLLMLLAGCFQGTSMLMNFVASPAAGFAVTFAIVNTNPLIVALWGIILWKEFAGTDWWFRSFFILMCLGFIVALVLVVLSSLL